MVLAAPAAISVSFVRQIDCMLRLRVGMLFTSPGNLSMALYVSIIPEAMHIRRV